MWSEKILSVIHFCLFEVKKKKNERQKSRAFPAVLVSIYL